MQIMVILVLVPLLLLGLGLLLLMVNYDAGIVAGSTDAGRATGNAENAA